MAPRRILLHIGTPKTGTTFLQELMWHFRDQLGEHDVHYPGAIPEAQFDAAIDLRGVDFNDWHSSRAEGAWQRLVEATRELSGTVVLSHEMFAEADEATAARALDDLSFADVELVLTLRDLGRQIPAGWQEDLKNRHWMSFEEYALSVSPHHEVAAWYGNEFWRRQDVPKVLERWSGDLPPDRVHLVTVPASGAGQEELWRRFAQVVGIDPDVADPRLPLLRRNRSLGRREAQVLRRVNVLLEDRLEWPQYGEVMAHLAEHVLGQHHDPILLPQEHRDWVAQASLEMVEALRDTGHPVVGDLDDLLVDPVAPPTACHPDEASDGELLGVAADLLASALFLKPVPPPEPPLLPHQEPPPRWLTSGRRALRQVHGCALRLRDRARSSSGR